MQDLSLALQTKNVLAEDPTEPQSYGSRSKDLTGQKFNKLTAIKRIGSKNKKALWLCTCDCGETTEVITSNLTSGRIKSCGCSRNTDMTGRKIGMVTVLKRTKIVDGMSYWISVCDCGNQFELPWSHLRSRKSCGCLAGEFHGLANTPIYYVWAAMRQRCNSKTHVAWEHYGGRGINVCKEWNESYVPFYNWAIQNGYEKGLTIDRIDVNGNYEPSNCRWVTMKVQSSNKRNSKKEVNND